MRSAMDRKAFPAASRPTSAAVGPTEEPVYPIRASENGRYFVDQKGNPVFWLGTTQWQLFREFVLEDARTILDNARSLGFAFVQVMLLGVGDGAQPSVYGEKPWVDDNPLRPNEAYFRHVDAVIQIARDYNLVLSVILFHQSCRKRITLRNARAWAKWLAQRYQNAPHLVWSVTPEGTQEFVPIVRELAAGLREGDSGYHPITIHPDPAPHPPGFLHQESWLSFHSLQTWKWVEQIYPMVTMAYNLTPVKPVVMAEGAYESGSEYGFDVTPLWIRRQAYYSYLAGGHHAYGHNDSWRVLPTWKLALDAPGAAQLRLLKAIFLDRQEWWQLVPDQTVFLEGGEIDGQVLNLAARHRDGRWIMVYLGDRASISLHMDRITAGNQVKAFWIDPRTGETAEIGRFPNTGTRVFSTPDGWEDALLILEASAG